MKSISAALVMLAGLISGAFASDLDTRSTFALTVSIVKVDGRTSQYRSPAENLGQCDLMARRVRNGLTNQVGENKIKSFTLSCDKVAAGFSTISPEDFKKLEKSIEKRDEK